MADILFVKTSSLGDVIHQMPAVTDAFRHLPGQRFVWVVEEAFVPLVRLHPAVSEIIPVALRRWRSEFLKSATWRELSELDRSLHARSYDAVIDTQGLLKSALIVARTGGMKHGYDSASITEKLASTFYNVRHQVSRSVHAIERNRRLTALSLGYDVQGLPDYGLEREKLRTSASNYAVLLHATARPEKEWPASSWSELGLSLNAGIELILPWGNERERVRAERLAALLPRARVPQKMPLDEIAKLIAGAQFVVGVDTGLLHLAAALGVPLVAIFGGSDPGLHRPIGSGSIGVTGTQGAPPSPAEVRSAIKRVAAIDV